MTERADMTTAQERDTAPAQDPREKPSSGPVLYLPFLVLFIGALWLMGYAFDQGNGVLWWVGLLGATAAFAVPLHLLRD